MTGSASLVSVSVRTAAAVAALLALGVALGSCGDTEEDVAPGTATTASPAPTDPASPTPLPATATLGPVPSGWTTYADSTAKLSIPQPPGLTVSEEQYELPERKGLPTPQGRTLWFRNTDGIPAMVLSVADNPANLSIEEWVGTYTGWSGVPDDIEIGGEKAKLDPEDQVGNPVPQIYFRHHGLFFTLQLNIHGIPDSGYPAALSEQDYTTILEGVRFAD